MSCSGMGSPLGTISARAGLHDIQLTPGAAVGAGSAPVCAIKAFLRFASWNAGTGKEQIA